MKPEPRGNTSRLKAPSIADQDTNVSATSSWDKPSLRIAPPVQAAAGEDRNDTVTSSWDIPSLGAAPKVQAAPDIPRVDDQSIPAPRSKGKGKAKKWTDPPIFQEDQVVATEPTKTLFSYNDDPEASSNVHGTTIHAEASEQKTKQPEQVSPVRDVTKQNQTTAAKPLLLQPLERKQTPTFTATPTDQNHAPTANPFVFQPLRRKRGSNNAAKWWNTPETAAAANESQPLKPKQESTSDTTATTAQATAPFEWRFKQESTNTATATTAQTAAAKPFEWKFKQKPEPLHLESTFNKRSFGETQNQPNALGLESLLQPQVRPKASAKPTLGEVFAPNAMKSMMESVAPKANYVTTPKATSAMQENAVPRAPLAFEPLPFRASKRTESPAASDASKSSRNPAKIARSSAIKKVETAPSTEQEASAQTTDAPMPSAQRTQEPEVAAASSATDSHPFASSSLERSREPMASTASSASASQFPKAPTPTAAAFTPTATSKLTMNAKSASFQPSNSFGNGATFGNAAPRNHSPTLSPFQASVMSKLTPEKRALFQQKMSQDGT